MCGDAEERGAFVVVWERIRGDRGGRYRGDNRGEIGFFCDFVFLYFFILKLRGGEGGKSPQKRLFFILYTIAFFMFYFLNASKIPHFVAKTPFFDHKPPFL